MTIGSPGRSWIQLKTGGDDLHIRSSILADVASRLGGSTDVGGLATLVKHDCGRAREHGGISGVRMRLLASVG
jgi:hypothetical protein